MIESHEQKIVDEAITSRKAIRAFLPTPVAREDIEKILEVASRAPSGTNTQPWKVNVLTGDLKERLSTEILKAFNDPAAAGKYTEEYNYYPLQWFSPYLERRRKIGLGLYSLLGISRENRAGMRIQHGRNFAFFDAPVGIIFTMDRVMEQGSWLDYGTFLQNIMIAARCRGLDTCPQAALLQFHRIITDVLQIPASEIMVCGMSLGYADHQKIENTLVTGRESVANFTRFFE